MLNCAKLQHANTSFTTPSPNESDHCLTKRLFGDKQKQLLLISDTPHIDEEYIDPKKKSANVLIDNVNPEEEFEDRTFTSFTTLLTTTVVENIVLEKHVSLYVNLKISMSVFPVSSISQKFTN